MGSFFLKESKDRNEFKKELKKSKDRNGKTVLNCSKDGLKNIRELAIEIAK